MAVNVSYPGVYVQEIPSGSRAIVGVPTSIAAFVGYTARGHDNVATRIFNFGDFERRFGGITQDSLVSHQVKQFFDNGGGQAIIVRVPKPDSVAADVDLLDGVDGPGTDDVAFTLTARSRGAWANSVVASVDYNNVSDTSSFNLTITDLVTGVSESFPNLSISAASPNFVPVVVNDPASGSDMVTATVPETNPGGRPIQTGIVGGDFTLTGGEITTIPNSADQDITISATRPSGAIVDVPVRLVDQDEVVPTSVIGVARMLERKISNALGAALPGAGVTVTPSHTGLGLRIVADFDISRIPDGVDTLLSMTDVTAGALAAFHLDAPTSNVAYYWLGQGTTEAAQSGATAGADGVQLPLNTDLIGSRAAFSGIYALERADIFNLLLIPDANRPLVADPDRLDTGLDPNAIYTEALNYCEERRAFLMIDPPPEVGDTEAAVEWISGGLTVAGANAAANWPRVRIPDPSNDYKPRVFGPSGVLAGLYARTDGARGIWKAAAGTEARLRTVQEPTYKLTDDENGVLNPLGLNCIRSFPIYGNVAWGARTTFGADERASEWKYVPVRRLALYIEESLYRGIQWAVFEPNDEPLWSQLRTSVGDFMHDLFTQGAFQGASARDAYFVRCDSTTTTQFDIDRGIVNVVVGFAPLKPAEFVILSIQQIVAQS